ncbi:MAG: redoxin domain-containing protein [Caldisericaceae bacterium]|nr:redoxin domain-containing protein [Caldisericaceae bacterium]
MKKVFKVVVIVFVLFFAAYGVYSFTKNIISYVSFRRQYTAIARVQNIKNGTDVFPDIKFVSPDGKTLSLYAELKKNNFVILSFGSIYCDNCHKEYEIIQKENILSKVPEGAELFLVVPESRDFVEQFESDMEINLPLYTVDNSVMKNLGINKIPAHFLIGKDKKAKAYIEGFKTSVLEDMFEYIKKNEH